LGAAPTGSGKSGAFILPALLLAAAPTTIFYGTSSPSSEKEEDKEGQIRTLLLAPSRELASQLHREVCRLGFGYKKGGLRAVLLSKQNASVFVSGKLGGKRGVDVLVSTPLRLVAALSSSNESAASCAPLSSVRLIVLDEADRLLDATDGSTTTGVTNENEQNKRQSGAARVRTFVEQIDDILAACPKTAIRALFSATMGSNVRNLAESILRNPIDVTIRPTSTYILNGANPDIDQKLFFVGKEEGKLLAIRQLIQKGIRPPVLIFLQSKERAQALSGELMYDGVNVDVLHSDKSKATREAAINKFRQGDTWFVITTDLCARGRCGRAGRKGEAITFFTESDFDHLRTIANVMKLSGCDIPDWMLSLKKNNAQKEKSNNPKRKRIDTIPSYDKKKQNNLIAKKKQKRQKLSLEEAKGEDCSSD